jgi:MoaA/NifB/PqqE/SkfB family radical SAM enzyme
MNSNIIDNNCVYQKKKWISVTGMCNNNCIFCLDADRTDKHHKTSKEIEKIIINVKKENYEKIILSGGDPTIHPNIIDFVKLAKKLNFKKIQIITNGRMFGSEKFSNEILDAGLDEVTFSIHGCNQKIHDEHTSVIGSFLQIIKGIKNVQNYSKNKRKIIINTDTCVTKKNYKQILKIIIFIVEKLNIGEINLMVMTPAGNAWKDKENIMVKYEILEPYIKKVIDYAKQKQIVLWLSRFPAKYLENYEDYIESPYKMVDNTLGRISMFMNKNIINNKKFGCYGDKCEWCDINLICDKLIKINSDEFIKKNEKHFFNLNKNGEIFIFEKPTLKLEDYNEKIKSFFETVNSLNLNKYKKFVNIPKCIFKSLNIKNIEILKSENVLYKKYINRTKKDYLDLAKELANTCKTKFTKCEKCIYYNDCEGVFVNYLKIYGSKEIIPIKK